MFSSSPLWIGDMRKTPCIKIKPVQSRIFHLLQLDKVELRCGTKEARFSAITNRGRRAQALPEHQKATVAGLVAAASGGFDEVFNLARGKVLEL